MVSYLVKTHLKCFGGNIHLVRQGGAERLQSGVLQAMDFPSWLQSNVQVADEVIIHMDLGTGREFRILQELLTLETLSLVDHIDVQWHYQAEVNIFFNAWASGPTGVHKAATALSLVIDMLSFYACFL